VPEDRGPSTGVIPSAEQVAARHPELDDAPLRARYALEGKLGRGGMGVVTEAHDRRIGRHVAIKRLAGPPTPEVVSRFVREARIQGRLDHPAIAPVYDLGIQSDGRPYFAMRKLAGVTLAELLRRHAAGDDDARGRYPRARLLDAFVAVCLALEYAHTRGVVHRDLKPSNVMLGDFGEVYVLDWGVAWLAGDPDRVAAVGTAGYMAPEQRVGAQPDPRADVWALGAILFEILAGAPLHDPADPAAPVDPRPSARAPALPVDLDLVCARALADDPADRFDTARELAEAVERHLDADRDVALRAAEAAEHAARARAALAQPGAADDPEARSSAMRHAGQALALDPDSGDAAVVIRRLLLEPPARLPAAAHRAMVDDDAALARGHARTSAMSYAGYLLAVPIVLALGLTEPLYLPLLVALNAFLVAVSIAGVRGRLPGIWPWCTVIGNAALLLALSRFLGPFVVAPPIAVLVAMAVMTNPQVRAYWVAGIGCAVGPLGALALEEIGVLASTVHAVDGDRLLLTATTVEVPGVASAVGLIVSYVTLLFLASHYLYRVATFHHATRRRLAVQAWHLRRLVPGRDDGDAP
jgi:eukaryotic-like serine/threonine-protein kinase